MFVALPSSQALQNHFHNRRFLCVFSTRRSSAGNAGWEGPRVNEKGGREGAVEDGWRYKWATIKTRGWHSMTMIGSWRDLIVAYYDRHKTGIIPEFWLLLKCAQKVAFATCPIGYIWIHLDYLSKSMLHKRAVIFCDSYRLPIASSSSHHPKPAPVDRWPKKCQGGKIWRRS